MRRLFAYLLARIEATAVHMRQHTGAPRRPF